MNNQQISGRASLPFLGEIQALRGSEDQPNRAEATSVVGLGIMNMTAVSAQFIDESSRATAKAEQKEAAAGIENDFSAEAKNKKIASSHSRLVFRGSTKDEKVEGELKDHKSDEESLPSGYLGSAEESSGNSSRSGSMGSSQSTPEKIAIAVEAAPSSGMRRPADIRSDIAQINKQLDSHRGELSHLANAALEINEDIISLMTLQSTGNEVLKKRFTPSINLLNGYNSALDREGYSQATITNALSTAEEAITLVEQEMQQEDQNLSVVDNEYSDNFEPLESSGGHTSLQERGSTTHAEGAATVTSAGEDYSSDFESPELTSGTDPEIG